MREDLQSKTYWMGLIKPFDAKQPVSSVAKCMLTYEFFLSGFQFFFTFFHQLFLWLLLKVVTVIYCTPHCCYWKVTLWSSSSGECLLSMRLQLQSSIQAFVLMFIPIRSTRNALLCSRKLMMLHEIQISE